MLKENNMRAITIYQAEDGSRFNKKEDAIRYENLCHKCDEINRRFVNIDRELNSKEFIQQNPVIVKVLFAEFMNVVAEAIPYYAQWAKECGAGIRHISHILKVLCDYNINCLDKLMYRFWCIDFDSGRQFQQPYFVKHQDEAPIEVK